MVYGRLGPLWFADDDRSGLSHLWPVWEEGWAALVDLVRGQLVGREGGVGRLLAGLSPEELERGAEDLFARMRGARAGGDWSGVEAVVAGWAERSARSDVDTGAWFEAWELVQRRLVTSLVERYAASPERLQPALHALDRVGSRALHTLTRAPLAAAEQLLIEERGRTDAALRRFERLSASGLLGVIVCDLVGNIREANETFLTMVGYTREELMSGGVGWADMTPPEWLPLDFEAIDQLRLHGVTRPWEKEYLRKDGSRVPILVGVAMLDETECVAFVLDITERKRVEELRTRSAELEHQNRRIREASRLKSEFLANMSHELRTPLNSIIGFADILHDGEVSPDSPDHRELLGHILDSGRHLLKLINDVLDLAKVEAGKLDFRPEPVLLSQAVTEVCSVLGSIAAAKGIRLEQEVDPEVDQVTLDPSRLKQVLYNFVSNAIKFTPDGGRVCIRARSDGADSVRLEVSDTGIGISSSDVGRLFVEFEQLDAGAAKKHAGTGLGLALTKRIVEAQEGSVGVKSALGEGSTFFAVLPRHRSRSPTQDDLPALPASRPGSSMVLVVEDDPNDQALLVKTLARGGYGLELASTGLQAVSACAARPFSAITLDLLLPDITGLEVLRRVRMEGKNRDTPVIIASVVAEQGVVGGFSVHDYLQKPIDTDELIESLDRARVASRIGTILVVDDDPLALRLMETLLTRVGHRVELRPDGAGALELAEREPPLAVIVDLLMPGMDGFEFLKRFRAVPGCAMCPAIVWTMKDIMPADHARLHRLAHAVVAKGTDRPGGLLEELAGLLATSRAAAEERTGA
jgi:PAS domain S-box-containing protein